MKRLSLFVCLAVVGFASVATARGNRTETVFRSDGIYTAPTTAALADVATNPVSDVKWKLKEGRVTLSYDLPAELVGETNTEIAMSGFFDPATGLYALSGALGTATCAATVQADKTTAMHCAELMPRLQVDLVATEAALAARIADPTEAARRLEVAVAFAHEPIGFVDFTLRTR